MKISIKVILIAVIPILFIISCKGPIKEVDIKPLIFTIDSAYFNHLETAKCSDHNCLAPTVAFWVKVYNPNEDTVYLPNRSWYSYYKNFKLLANDTVEINFSVKDLQEVDVKELITIPPMKTIFLLCASENIVKYFNKTKFQTHVEYINSMITAPEIYYVHKPTALNKLTNKNIWIDDTIVRMQKDSNYYIRYLPDNLLPF